MHHIASVIFTSTVFYYSKIVNFLVTRLKSFKVCEKFLNSTVEYTIKESSKKKNLYCVNNVNNWPAWKTCCIVCRIFSALGNI